MTIIPTCPWCGGIAKTLGAYCCRTCEIEASNHDWRKFQDADEAEEKRIKFAFLPNPEKVIRRAGI